MKNEMRRLLIGLGILMVTLLIFFLTEDSSEAFTRCGTEMTFYSDASQTQVIGALAYSPESCGCVLSSWGDTSPWRTLDYTTCY